MQFDAADVRPLRERLKWSQAQLAGRLGVAQSTVARYELGTQVPSKPVSVLLHQLKQRVDRRDAERQRREHSNP